MRGRSDAAVVVFVFSFLLASISTTSAQIRVVPKPEKEQEASPPTEDYLTRNLKTARSLIKLGDFERALALLSSLQKTYGDIPQITAELKNTYRGMKDYASLRGLIEQEMATAVDKFTSYCELGEVYFLSDSLNQARVAWETAFGLARQDESRYLFLAGYYTNYGFYDEAVSVYRRARVILGRPSAFTRELADLFITFSNYTEAVSELLILMKNEPKETDNVARQIVEIASESEQWQVIEQSIRFGIQADPQNAVLYRILGGLNVLDHDLASAFENYRQADLLSKATGNYILSFVNLCFDNGEYTSAIQAADYYLANVEDGSRPQIMLLKAKSLAELGLTSAALQLLEAIDSLTTDQVVKAEAWLTSGEINATKVKDYVAAKRQFQRVIEGPRATQYSSKAKVRLAEVDIITGHFDQALDLLENLIKLGRDEVTMEKAIFLKAEILFFTHDFDQAAKEYGTLIKQYPNGFFVNDCLDRQGLLASAAGDTALYLVADAHGNYAATRTDSAISLMEKASMNSSSGAREYALYTAAVFYSKAGRWESAVSAYEKYNQVFPEGLYSDRALFGLAQIYYEQAGQPVKASQLLDKLVTDYPTSPLLEKARSYLNKIRSS